VNTAERAFVADVLNRAARHAESPATCLAPSPGMLRHAAQLVEHDDDAPTAGSTVKRAAAAAGRSVPCIGCGRPAGSGQTNGGLCIACALRHRNRDALSR
jgi:hypothetical protein